ncbi:MAG: sulfite exporter TauE/SafE family protein [Acidaminococcaceae bacterium]
MELQFILLVSMIIFAASLVQAVTGFGFALVAAPFLTFVMGAKETVIFLLFSGMFMKSIMFVKTWKDGSLSQVLLLFVGSILGALPGAYFLKNASASSVKVFIGLSLLAATIALIKNFKVQIVHKRLTQLTYGFVSGFCGASAGLNGPPIVCYYLNENLPKELMRANLVRFFLLGNAGTLLLSYFFGSFHPAEMLNITLLSIPAMLAGWALGERIFYKINPLIFKRLTIATVFASALITLLSGIV